MAASSNPLAGFEATLEEYLVKKAPFQLPDNVKEILVKIAPYLVIVGLVLLIPTLFSAFGMSTAFNNPFMAVYAPSLRSAWFLNLATAGITAVFYVFAVPGLFSRTAKAWQLLFYASLVSLIGGVLIGIIGYSGGLLGTLLSTLIGWYLLFQVKGLYRN
jgi:hypothetical protein